MYIFTILYIIMYSTLDCLDKYNDTICIYKADINNMQSEDLNNRSLDKWLSY